jgi:hypothetical protein
VTDLLKLAPPDSGKIGDQWLGGEGRRVRGAYEGSEVARSSCRTGRRTAGGEDVTLCGRSEGALEDKIKSSGCGRLYLGQRRQRTKNILL